LVSAPVRAVAGIGERVLTRAATGAAINASQDAAIQQTIDQKIDWGRVALNGALGAGLGLVLSVPEASALSKAFGAKRPLEGKPLSLAIEEIAAETGVPPPAVQARINEMVGYRAEPTPEAVALRRADAEVALAEPAGAQTEIVSSALQLNHDPAIGWSLYGPEGKVVKHLGHVNGGKDVAAAIEEAHVYAEDNRVFGAIAVVERVQRTKPVAAIAPAAPAQAQSLLESRAQRRADVEAAFAEPLPPAPAAPAELPPPVPGVKVPSSGSAELPGGQAPLASAEAPPVVNSPPALSPEAQVAIWKQANTRTKGPRAQVGLPADGVPDLLNAIEDLGGVPGPRRGSKAAEYDGYASAFGEGPARNLRRAGGGGVDTFYPQLEASGYRFSSQDEFYQAVANATSARKKVAKTIDDLRYGAKFDAALFGNAGRARELKARAPINSDALIEGATMNVRGQPARVARVDEDGTVHVANGVKRAIPPNTPIFPDKGRVRNNKMSTDFMAGAESGFANIDALIPLARAAAGGVLGYASGDTPEERVRNALLGMGLVALASPALAKRLTARVVNAPVSREITELAQRRLLQLRLRVAPQSVLPDAIRRQLRLGAQAERAVTQGGLDLSRDLETTIYGVGDKAAQAAATETVGRFLNGLAPLDAMPPPVRLAARKLRDYVDTLSDRAVAEGVVQGQLAQTFLDGKGSYLRRSYDIFLNPDFKPAPGAVDAAITAVEKANGFARPEAEALVAGILDKHGNAYAEQMGNFLMGRGKVAGKDVGSLVRRKDLLPEIRALLGEVKDPILASNQTIPRLARLIENDAAQRQVRTLGSQLGLFSPQRSLTHSSPLVAEGSATHDVLAGLYAAPEIAAALQRVAGSGRMAFVPEMLWKTLTTANTVAKIGKTVLNPPSYAPNFYGGVFANIFNGNFRYSHSARGLALGAEELGVLRRFLPGNPSRAALQTELTELRKLGLTGESVNSGDLLRTIQSSFFGGLRDKWRSTLSAPSKLYGQVDDFNRYVAWQSERARYAKAYPGWTDAQLKAHAADVVRATTPTYSEIPQVVKQLSVAGLMPSFVNFTWEVFRNTKNSVRIGLRDLQDGIATGNPALRNAGALRLTTVTAGLAAVSMTGITKLSRDSNGITEEKDRAVRYFSPPWNRNGMLLYLTRADAGQPVQVANASYLVPHALLWQAIEAGRRGSDEGKTIPEFFGALNEQFGLGNNVLLPAVTGAFTGFDTKTGRSIPKTAVEPTLGDRVTYLGDEAFKPLFVDFISKFVKATTGETGDYGRVYSQSEQLKRLIGVRAQTIDPVRAVPWKARDLGKQFAEAGDILRLREKRMLAPEVMEGFYRQAEDERQRVFADMGAMLGHARALGVSDDTVIASLRAARVSATTILGVLEGRYEPMPRDKAKTPADILADLDARPPDQRRAALAQLYRDDPSMGKAVVGRINERGKGRTERDKLILGLGVQDGERAAYIARRVGELPTTDDRREFLRDLRRKGVLTDEVFRQMAKPATP